MQINEVGNIWNKKDSVLIYKGSHKPIQIIIAIEKEYKGTNRKYSNSVYLY